MAKREQSAAPGARFGSESRASYWAGLLGDSDPIRRVKEIVQRVAATDSTVLISGETGTGKEVVANYIHCLSHRSAHPLVCVNCSAIPDTLLESELFGFEKGAFTGAVARQEGKLRQANGGTIFLDEIGEMSLMAQAKVLRVIEAQEIQPLGASTVTRVNVRVLAATLRDLRQLVSTGEFREDLFFRLSVVPLRLPPLRERPSDIPGLVRRLLEELNVRYHRNVEGVSAKGMEFLCAQEWPGNVRQLRNILERALVSCSSNWISKEDLTFQHWSTVQHGPGPSETAARSRGTDAQLTPDQIREALIAANWNKAKAARLLSRSRTTVYRKMARYGIREERMSASASAASDASDPENSGP